MILKWITPNKVWHLKDCIEEVANHGHISVQEAQALANRYDGESARLVWYIDAASSAYEDHSSLFRYVVVTINGVREHMLIEDTQVYVLSDEGKTVDRF